MSNQEIRQDIEIIFGWEGRQKCRKQRLAKVKEIKRAKKMRRRNTDNRDSIDTILGLTAFIADVFSKRNKTPEITPPSPVEPKKEVKPREQKPPAQPVRPVQTPIQSAITNGLALSQLTMPPMPMYYYMPAQQIQMPYGFIPQVQYPVVKPMVQQRKQGPLRRCATHIAISHYILAQMRKQKIEAN